MKKILQTVKSSEKQSSFGIRLKKAFHGAQNKEIAVRLGVSNAAVTTYVQGRIPPPDVLLRIHRLTGCSLHWLMTGEGPEEAKSTAYSQQLSSHCESRPQVIVIANQQGGEAKSTSAAMLAIEFAKRGHRTLLIDAKQGNCSYMLFSQILRSVEEPRVDPIVYLQRTGSLKGRAFFRSPYKGLDLCSSHERMKSLLRLSTITGEYSVVILDTDSIINPFESDDVLAASLVSAPNVLIPTRGYLASVEATLQDLSETRRHIGSINLLGIFFAQVNYISESRLSRLRAQLNELQPGKVFNTVVRKGIDIAGLYFSDLNHLTRQRSRVLADYRALAGEILSRLERSDAGDDDISKAS
jgi:chromosome partitioning protein